MFESSIFQRGLWFVALRLNWIEAGLVFFGVVAFFDNGGCAEDVEGGGFAAGGLEGHAGGQAIPFCWLADWNKVVSLWPFADLFLHDGATCAQLRSQ